jgi:hypothetical protein
MSVGIRRQNIIILFWTKGGCTVLFLGNINVNQKFILDSHWPFICRVAIYLVASGEGWRLLACTSIEGLNPCSISFPPLLNVVNFVF